jgi:hypothetical protein
MNLEKVESRCFNFLKQATNPLVPLDTLLNYVRRDDECLEVDAPSLVTFLRQHELFRVIDPPDLPVGPADADALHKLGFRAQPLAVLVTRVPTEQDFIMQFAQQMQNLEESLHTAARDAEMQGDANRANEATRLLFRSKQLTERFRRFFRSGSGPDGRD